MTPDRLRGATESPRSPVRSSCVFARRGGATVPKRPLAVATGPQWLETLRPAEFTASGAALHGGERSSASQPWPTECEQDLAKIVVRDGVRRVEEDDVVRARRAPVPRRSVPLCRCGPRRRAGPASRTFSRTMRAARVRLHQQGVGRAAGQRLQADGAGAARTGRATRTPPSVPSSDSQVENSPSRARSDVGRVPLPGGTARRRPPAAPAITRVMVCPSDCWGAAAGCPAAPGGPPGSRSRRVLREQERLLSPISPPRCGRAAQEVGAGRGQIPYPASWGSAASASTAAARLPGRPRSPRRASSPATPASSAAARSILRSSPVHDRASRAAAARGAPRYADAQLAAHGTAPRSLFARDPAAWRAVRARAPSAVVRPHSSEGAGDVRLFGERGGAVKISATGQELRAPVRELLGRSPE